MQPIRISYFSDVLCVWAYIAQIRLDELSKTFQDQVTIDYHFVPVFGNAREKLNHRWREKGGLKGYSDHVHEAVKSLIISLYTLIFGSMLCLLRRHPAICFFTAFSC